VSRAVSGVFPNRESAALRLETTRRALVEVLLGLLRAFKRLECEWCGQRVAAEMRVR
jgi:hypothetical protein